MRVSQAHSAAPCRTVLGELSRTTFRAEAPSATHKTCNLQAGQAKTPSPRPARTVRSALEHLISAGMKTNVLNCGEAWQTRGPSFQRVANRSVPLHSLKSARAQLAACEWEDAVARELCHFGTSVGEGGLSRKLLVRDHEPWPETDYRAACCTKNPSIRSVSPTWLPWLAPQLSSLCVLHHDFTMWKFIKDWDSCAGEAVDGVAFAIVIELH